MLDPQHIQTAAARAWHPDDATAEQPKSAIDDLRNGGTLSRTLPGYRERAPQLEMAQIVEQAILEGKHAVVEASTGTGKSLSYLIPAIRSGKKTIISTANKALQEQLFQKDVPFCQRHIQSFDAALLKGKNNYLCLQRFYQEGNEGLQVHVQDPTFKRLEKAVGKNTWNGDFEALSFSVSRELRARITVDDNECARRKCPLFASCYYYQAREQAKKAQIIITNHDLLLLDAQSHHKLLPVHDVVVIDEAHTLEGIATKQFTIEIRPSQILSLLALQRVKATTEEKTREQAKQQAEALWAHLDTLLPGNGRAALHQPIKAGLTLARTIERLSNQLSSNKPITSTAEEEALYNRTISRCDNLASSLQTLFSLADKQNAVYYLERIQKHLTASMTPLDVAPILRDTLFSCEKIIICTSATLSTPDEQTEASFSYFRAQVGMSRPDTLTRILPLVFNYPHNALLYLPQDLPEPAYGNTAEAAAYERALAERIRQLVEASQGRAFLLFSSRRILNTVADQLSADLRTNDFSVFVQGELPTSELIKQFRTSKKAVLFGLKTFWEGVDVAGEALSLVVIDKLPFPPIDDPVIAAKLKYIERAGHNAFTAYSVPAITLSLKQGVGRLIRSDTDRGVMAILDRRLYTKAYGKQILSCLPPAKRVVSLAAVEAFFTPLADEQQQFALAQAILQKYGEQKHTYLKQMTNGEIMRKMQEIISNETRTGEQLVWLQKGLSLILAKSKAA